VSRVVALITGRAGSKRLPGKNLAELDGRPLIAHTCEAARASGALEAIYVNTDCPQIAAAATAAGATCPILRPKHLAADDTDPRDSNLFLLDFLAKRGERYDAVLVLQPTSPLRAPEDIRGAVELFDAEAPCAVVGVTPLVPHNWLGRVGPDGAFVREADDDLMYRINGALYLYSWSDYVTDWPPARTVAYVMPPERSVDVDRALDLAYARFLVQQRAAQSAGGLAGVR
jgi:CMP-N-acetylneuraminic acid synthetase